MFDRFSQQARRAMGLSRQESQRFQHDHIGPEHILLGLLRENGRVGIETLLHLGLDLERVRSEVEGRLALGNSMVTMGQIPFTPGAKRVLELTLEEAHDLGHDHIGTGHLLLGLIREPDGVAGRVLRELGAELEEARRHVLDAEPEDPAADGPRTLLDELRRDNAALKVRLAALEARVRKLEES